MQNRATLSLEDDMITLGIDPGQHGGVALVEGQWGTPPRLLGLRHIGGLGPRWYERAKAALGELRPFADQVDRVWIEEPPHVARRWREGPRGPELGHRLQGRLQGDQEGLASWLGLGRYQGMLQVACYETGWGWPTRIPQGEWVAPLARVIQRAKRGGGEHRISEAALLVEGASEALEGVPKTFRVDVAEAVLIAASALLWTPGEAPC